MKRELGVPGSKEPRKERMRLRWEKDRRVAQISSSGANISSIHMLDSLW
jgi:hypothetical protein